MDWLTEAPWITEAGVEFLVAFAIVVLIIRFIEWKRS